MRKFPENFFWGAAASAPQTEGAALEHGKSATTWDYWFETEPERFHNNVGPKHTSNVYNQYKEDAQLMQDMSMNSYRTSISWARLLPDGKTVNEEAVAYYRDYFQTLKDKGVEPIMNLFHFDMPMWLMEKGGWEARESVDAFAFYADTAFTLFGDIIKKWATFNEPMVHIECGYLGDAHYPAVRDYKRAIQVGFHTVMAHAKAVEAYRKNKNNDGEISCILNLSPVYAKSDDEKDQHARHMADLLLIRSLLDPIVLGKFPEELIELYRKHDLLPVIEDGDLETLEANKVDFLGVNYYQPLRVQHRENPNMDVITPGSFFMGYDWPEKRINPHRGWEIYPEGIYDISMRIKNDYGNLPWLISENGMGVEGEEKFQDENGIIQDDYRIEFINDHLEFLHKSIEEGSNCFGYHLWTFVDCWSWLNSYKNRYGFYRVDIDDNFKRYPKKSSFWMKEVIEQNAIK